MTLTEYEIWYHARYRRTSSALISLALIISDLIAFMISFGSGFFLVNIYDLSAINFKSFVTYWPYLPVFIIIFWMFHLYPGVALAPAEELRCFCISSLISHGSIVLSRYIEDHEFGPISIAFVISFLFSSLILLLCRSCTHTLLGKTKLNGIPAVIYGSGVTGRLIVDKH
jgi:FlaA1/EpsC-like NDP-sugar epimerase